MDSPQTRKLRLVKALVQFTYVIDDGSVLTEYVTEPVGVSAAQWPSFATVQYPKAAEALAKSLQAEL